MSGPASTARLQTRGALSDVLAFRLLGAPARSVGAPMKKYRQIPMNIHREDI
jgi:hypothetical protein